MAQVDIVKTSATEYLLLATVPNMSYMLQVKGCSNLTTVSTGPVGETEPLELTLDKDEIYYLFFFENGEIVYRTLVSTYESLEYTFVRKFQKYVCGCGCNGNCNEEESSELAELFTIGYNLLENSFNIPSIEVSVQESFSCSTKSFLSRATHTNIIYGGKITNTKDTSLALAKIFSILYLKDRAIASNKADVDTKWRLTQILDCISQLGCNSLKDLSFITFSLPFKSLCTEEPVDPTPTACTTSPVEIVLEEMLENITPIGSFDDRLIQIEVALRNGFKIDDIESCCTGCSEDVIYLLANDEIVSDFIQKLSGPESCCISKIFEEAGEPDKIVNTVSTCEHVNEEVLLSFANYANSTPSPVVDLTEINYLTKNGEPQSLLQQSFWESFITTFFNSPDEKQIPKFFTFISENGLGVFCVVNEDNTKTVHIGTFEYLSSILNLE